MMFEVYWPRGEYKSYVGDILALLEDKNTTIESLAGHLESVAHTEMGLPRYRKKHHQKIARMLLTLRDQAMD